MTDDPADQRLLAFDFGLRHIGVAVGQTLTATATPLDTVKARDGKPDWPQLERLLEEWRPDALVVGLPLNMDGSSSPLCARARAFARRLHGRSGLPVLLVDERLSTREVWQQREAAAAEGRRSRRSSGADHALAAVFILETHLAAPDASEDAVPNA